MITPFDASGAVDVAEAVRLAQFLVERGNDGSIVSGTTGESPALENEEKLALFGAIKAALGRTRHRHRRHDRQQHPPLGRADARRPRQPASTAILAVVPYYSKPPQDGLLRHFGAIAEATSLPVILYNIPGRTERQHAAGDGARAGAPPSEHRRRSKSRAATSPSSPRSCATACARISRSGRATTICSCRRSRLGAYGCVSVAGHLCSRELRAMAEAFDGGDVETAGRSHRDLQALFGALFATTSPIPVKWAMDQFGFQAGECRSPLGVMPEDLKRVLQPLIAPFRPE